MILFRILTLGNPYRFCVVKVFAYQEGILIRSSVSLFGKYKTFNFKKNLLRNRRETCSYLHELYL